MLGSALLGRCEGDLIRKKLFLQRLNIGCVSFLVGDEVIQLQVSAFNLSRVYYIHSAVIKARL